MLLDDFLAVVLFCTETVIARSMGSSLASLVTQRLWNLVMVGVCIRRHANVRLELLLGCRSMVLVGVGRCRH